MHYIIGTFFKIDSSNFKIAKRYSLVKEGIYKLINIRKNEDKFEYSFVFQNNEKLVLKFSSCKEADTLLASLRNETLPTYVAPAG